MNKRIVVGIVAGLILIGIVGTGGNNQPSNLDATQPGNTKPINKSIPEKVKPTCDGTIVTTSCKLDGANYKTYVYHPAVAEITHTETETTYREEVTGTCTLCNDGTFSPSCATGRGACSHHDGVAQWDAPVSRNVPVTTPKTVVDAPAQEAYYEKIVE